MSQHKTDMKILFVCSGNSEEGLGTIVKNQGESLRSHGVVIEYFTVKDKGFFGYLTHIPKLRKCINITPYDIIHAHYGLCGIISILAKNKSSKLVISFMGSDLLANRYEDRKLLLFRNLLVIMNRYVAKYAHHVIVKSQIMLHKINNKNISVIPNGLNSKQFFPIDQSVCLKKVGWDEKHKHILFLANPDRPEKNFKLAIAALNLLNHEDIQVHTLNKVNHNDVVYYLNASQVCILSSYYEGSPNVVKEAMACNCPVVSTDVGDVNWLFGDLKGYYLSGSVPDEFAIRIKDALTYRKEFRFTNGRQRIFELKLDSGSIANRIIEVYQKVLSK